jgi:hypothetical protein
MLPYENCRIFHFPKEMRKNGVSSSFFKLVSNELDQGLQDEPIYNKIHAVVDDIHGWCFSTANGLFVTGASLDFGDFYCHKKSGPFATAATLCTIGARERQAGAWLAEGQPTLVAGDHRWSPIIQLTLSTIVLTDGGIYGLNVHN